MPLDLKIAADTWLNARKKTFAHDRTLTVGASEIGQCARRVWFAKKGKAHDAEYVPADGAAFRGDMLEDHFTINVVRQALLTQMPGAELIWAGQGQHTIQALEWRLSATPDGMIVKAPRDALKGYGVDDCLSPEIVVEMKSFDPRIHTLPKQEHLDQLNVQLGLIQKEGTYRPMFGIVVYTNASFPNDIRVFPAPFDRIAFENQIRRALHIMGANHELHLRPEGKIAGEKECQHCPFVHSCLGYSPMRIQASPGYEKLPSGEKTRFSSAIRKLVRLREGIEEAKTDARGLEADIKDIMNNSGQQRVFGKLGTGEGFQVRWEQHEGRDIMDKEKLTEALAKLGLKYKDVVKRSAPSERLTVTILPKDSVRKPTNQENRQNE